MRVSGASIAEPDGVAIDHAGEASPATAAGEGLGDAFGLGREEAWRLDEGGIHADPDRNQHRGKNERAKDDEKARLAPRLVRPEARLPGPPPVAHLTTG